MKQLCNDYKVLKLRILELDGLRGVAVAMILVWHFIGALLDKSLGIWTKAVYGITILGRTGVDLFFVLSGFLITGIMLDRQQTFFKFIRSFYIRRFLRIVPSYMLLVSVFWGAVMLGVQSDLFNSQISLWYYITFTQNLWMAVHSSLGPHAISVTWSVTIEEQFYLAFPFLVLLTPRKKLPVFLLIISLGSILFRATAWLVFENPIAAYVHTLSRLDGLAAGAAIALFWRHENFESFIQRYSVLMLKIFRLLLWVIPLFLISIKINLPLNMAIWGHIYLTVFYSLCILLILAQLKYDGVRWLRYRWLVDLGSISYTVYLFHPLFLSGIFLLANRKECISSLPDLGLAIIALCISIIYAKFSLKFFERPLIRLGGVFSY